MTLAPTLRRLESLEEANWCAELMSSSEPWRTLGRSFAASLDIIRDATRETYVAMSGDERVGFVILSVVGPFMGYLQTLCIIPERRGEGLGSALLELAEERIFSVSPNVFLCVSSFNHDARRLYERSGYVYVGELADYLVEGYSELLYRKTRGSWDRFHRLQNGKH